jgi:hypothetical protein
VPGIVRGADIPDADEWSFAPCLSFFCCGGVLISACELLGGFALCALAQQIDLTLAQALYQKLRLEGGARRSVQGLVHHPDVGGGLLECFLLFRNEFRKLLPQECLRCVLFLEDVGPPYSVAT